MSQNSHDADRKFLRNFGMVIIGLASAGILFGLIANFAIGEGEGKTFKSQQFLMIAPEHPAGQTHAAATPPAPTTLAAASSKSAGKGRSGQQVVEQVCAACHTTKFMNAPQIGNKEEWGPIVKANSLDTLVERALKGYGNMPPQGNVVSSAEEHAAIKYMVEEKTGLKLKK
ncbi:MAG TPA: c-type cytochrome [Nitrococcus sp.]|nr:c-type cytochrome [Nitrococcus sp.]